MDFWRFFLLPLSLDDDDDDNTLRVKERVLIARFRESNKSNGYWWTLLLRVNDDECAYISARCEAAFF